MRSRAWLAAGAALLLAACSSASGSDAGTVAPEGRGAAAAVCPLSGLEASSPEAAARPAIAVKVENSPAAYPLSGLEHAEVVYEEQVEGGMTRFMALFHCSDVSKVGPVRSAREVDPAIMTPATRILASAGGNDIVRKVLASSGVVLLDEDTATGGALRRVDRPGIGLEHTLYGNTRLLRRLGAADFPDPPPAGIFRFGDLGSAGRPAKSITVEFGGATSITYTWDGASWVRAEHGTGFVMESGEQIAVDNVVVEEHDVNNSTRIFDVAGNPSIEIADVTGSGRALVFRDGRVIVGRWVREKATDKVTYQTKGGEEIALKPGTTWIELVPSTRGDVKGSFAYD